MAGEGKLALGARRQSRGSDPQSNSVGRPEVKQSPSASVPTAGYLPESRGRRLLNVVVAAAAILFTWPLWILIAAVVKLTSRGPIFHTQTRVGLDRRSQSGPVDARRGQDLGGKPFTIFKFRTMHNDAEGRTGATWATKADPRVTLVGRFLRQYRLDELPQLVNVLKGDMNVVGPRPERPTIFVQLRTEIGAYQDRQRVRPGITGLAQISQEYDSNLDDVRRKVRFDLEYISRQSALQDFLIMVTTVPVMLFRKGSR